MDLLLRRRRLKIEQGLDVATHAVSPGDVLIRRSAKPKSYIRPDTSAKVHANAAARDEPHGERNVKASCAALSAVLLSISASAFAADYPAPKQGDWIARDFKFHTGEVMPELRLHYATIGEP